MPRVPDEAPTEIADGDRTVLRHPAFGQITVNRISGCRTLYGSDFEHNGFVRVAIYPSELHRHLSYDAPYHSLKPLIEVDMSEAQWGSFVSSFGVGMGTQCTLNVVGDERKPGFPLQERARLHFGEGDEVVRRALEDLKSLRAKVEAGVQGLSKSRQADMLRDVDHAIGRLGGTLPFVAQSFAQEMEKVVEKAKVEVHAYVTRTVVEAGLSALGASGPLRLEGPADSPEKPEFSNS